MERQGRKGVGERGQGGRGKHQDRAKGKSLGRKGPAFRRKGRRARGKRERGKGDGGRGKAEGGMREVGREEWGGSVGLLRSPRFSVWNSPMTFL